MKTYMIGYDLNRPGQNYKELIEAIKKLGNWWHCLDSTWLVKTNTDAVTIVNQLKPYIDRSDELLVARIADDAAWIGFDAQCSDWLKKNVSYQ